LQEERILEPSPLDPESCPSQVDICIHKTRDSSPRLPCLLHVALPRQRIYSSIYTSVRGLDTLDEGSWKLFVLFRIQINSSPYTLHWKIWSVL